MRKGLSLSIVLSLGASNYVFTQEPTLCEQSEEVYFSCASEDKVISVCLTKTFSPDFGNLTYRIGTRDSLELVFSSSYTDLNNKFLFGSSSYAKGSTIELAFTKADQVYTIHSDVHAFRPDSSGVFVEQGDKQVTYDACDKPRQSHKKSLLDLGDIGFSPTEPRHIGTKAP